MDVKHQYFFNIKYFQSCLTGNSLLAEKLKETEEKWDGKTCGISCQYEVSYVMYLLKNWEMMKIN